MINRIKQIINFIFNKPKLGEMEEVKTILSPLEYEIFMKMDTYDKVHCLGVYKDVKKDEKLSKENTYIKLALLHDCGKENIGLFRRIKKVVFKDELLEQHPILGYKKLKDINLELAELIKVHHSSGANKNMKRFQDIDDKN